jgi:serine/threonine protein kinase
MIGDYQVIRSIGKGGMGEVLLVYDPKTQREVALKKIRDDLKDKVTFRNRFLREAKITSGLTHPGIISIFSITQNEDLYYTMPYVEGKTLKTLLKRDEGYSIPPLMPIFKSICQTVAYAHSKGIIHRDIKPENILVGNFGEVIILDWGLAQQLDEKQPNEEEEVLSESNPELTHPGKIVGTLAYMAPERAQSQPASPLTDIYALGVILYQMLTLHLPFERPSIKDFRKNHGKEKWIEPEEMAPYRDVPLSLSLMAKKALAANPKERYQTLELMLKDLSNHMEGKSGWFELKRLSVKNKEDWEFQENFLIAKHIAVTPTHEAAEWVSLMISKAAFSDNIQIKLSCYIGKDSSGIGILFNVPEAAERDNPLSGYCLWLGTEDEPHSCLFRNTAHVMHLPEVTLKKETWNTINIEKIDNLIHFTLNGVKRFKYVSFLPLLGAHVGIVSRDEAYELDEISIAIGSQNLQVSCLSIPDAFLSSRDYKRALAEYRRIGVSFPGHAEGREALFRAGITLLEQAKNEKNSKTAGKLYISALEEFEKLHRTPGAPLEYLGKALVYEALQDNLEEVKCLELALRRYQKHPLIPPVKEQIIYRMHETTSKSRYLAYKLILIVLRWIPEVGNSTEVLSLFRGLLSRAEPLPFIENPLDPTHFGKEESKEEKKASQQNFGSTLAFWLAEPLLLQEILEECVDSAIIGNILYFMIELGCWTQAESVMKNFKEVEQIALLEPLITCHKESLSNAYTQLTAVDSEDIGIDEFRSWSYLMQYALRHDQEEMIEKIASHLLAFNLSLEDRITLDAYRIWAYLAKDQIDEAGWIFETYSAELLNQETTLLHPLYGCYLYATEGEEIARIHFAGVIETPFPRTWALLGHELTSGLTKNPTWMAQSFMFERRMLYRQLRLYYCVSGKRDLEAEVRRLERYEYVAFEP